VVVGDFQRSGTASVREPGVTKHAWLYPRRVGAAGSRDCAVTKQDSWRALKTRDSAAHLHQWLGNINPLSEKPADGTVMHVVGVILLFLTNHAPATPPVRSRTALHTRARSETLPRSRRAALPAATTPGATGSMSACVRASADCSPFLSAGKQT